MKLIRLAASAAALLAAILCSGAGTGVLASRVLTPDGTDTYSIKGGTTVTMTAPATNTGTNLRAVYWSKSAAAVTNSRVCVNWTTQSAESVQQGTAHNIVALPDRTRAITLTKNVIYQIYWVFNVHVWDSTQDPAFTQVAQFNMIDVMFRPDNSYQPFPWRVCTDLIGATLRFKIWFPATGMAEPAWSDPAYARSFTFPATYAAWLVPGFPGFYIGHLPIGGSAKYSNLSAAAVSNRARG